ncbi:hypothetical protein POJ06DRAFT_244948, partial [Lipomyces tetrasporus]
MIGYGSGIRIFSFLFLYLLMRRLTSMELLLPLMVLKTTSLQKQSSKRRKPSVRQKYASRRNILLALVFRLEWQPHAIPSCQATTARVVYRPESFTVLLRTSRCHRRHRHTTIRRRTRRPRYSCGRKCDTLLNSAPGRTSGCQLPELFICLICSLHQSDEILSWTWSLTLICLQSITTTSRNMAVSYVSNIMTTCATLVVIMKLCYM